MKKTALHPFENESDCLQIGDLTIENRVDRVSIFGNIDLTKDKIGLATALQLKKLIDATVALLEKEELPDQISIDKPKMVENPFV